MIEITPALHLDDSEIQIDYVRAAGPGGQNVNKVATVAQLRFDVRSTSALEADVKERLIRLGGSRVTEDGVLIIEARRYRSQEQNRQDAIRRLANLIRQAIIPPKVRKATRPSVTAKAARLGAKKRRGELKRVRSYNPDDWE